MEAGMPRARRSFGTEREPAGPAEFVKRKQNYSICSVCRQYRDLAIGEYNSILGINANAEGATPASAGGGSKGACHADC
jgi:hypothetical protein